ncbi:MAG TPA: GMC family oxidoreductase [Chthonomonas sp.]|uniref:GMC family oxidoreductase n=1 Tax=Chthonomonas sp. TaxID=2282153 RepID=UPI002B4B9366|nr:GMC family oxidoreductase [Chthonomonas sp.]HLI49795.1 GMC family oxidoreductase [Chthonomonas sp.]
MPDYDAIVIGAGAAGGIVACLLAEAGKQVLLLERGPNLATEQIGRDHLRNQRLSQYGHNAGPDGDGHPRVATGLFGERYLVRPYEGGYQNNAACVGGGTRVYGAQAWRFMEEDFRMASLYGVPEGSSLADWPLSYSDLEPYYERAEWELGVCGDSGTLAPPVPRRKSYPMPPMPLTRSGQVLARGAQALGWKTCIPPLLINSVPYNGRPACVQCQHCVGFGCPSDSKNGTHNTLLPRALATGLCTLKTHAVAERIETDGRGNVTGVSYILEENGRLERHTATAKRVVVSAGAIESARLLLLSASPHHPNGLGNRYDLVGRNLQGHYYPGALGLMEEPVYDGIGPGVCIATCQFNHHNPGIIGGGMLANEFIKLPIIFWKSALPPDLPRRGLENKRWMRENYRRTLHVMGPVHEIPNPNCRVTLDPDVRDRYGLPVARLEGVAHTETVRTAHYMWGRAKEWLLASGAIKVWGDPPGYHLSAGQHQAGTCRMGHDPKTSVTDPWGRVHDFDNLFIIDASLHVTNGGFNPVLTIMALAYRCGEYLVRSF